MRPVALFPFVLTLGAFILASRSGAYAQDGRQEGPIEIDKCQTISQPGSYKLVNNITFKGPSGSACLSITADFVTIDLAGFNITSISTFPPFPPPNGGTFASFTAIKAGDNTNPVMGTTVRNGSISGNFTAGVILNGDGSIVEGIHVSRLGVVGLGISARGIVRGNTAVQIEGIPGNGVGISAAGLIAGNYVSDTRSTGIEAGQGSTVIGNTSANSERGIVVDCPANVTDNTATGTFPNLALVLNGTGCNNTNNVAP
jgi:hypothetical protein